MIIKNIFNQKHIFVITFLITINIFLPAQDIKLNSNIGFAGYGSPFDGYYYSFDISLPLVKGLEIAPTFTSCSNITHQEVEYIWTYNDGVFTTMSSDDHISGDISTAYELYLILNPLRWFNKSKLNKIDFGLGFGFGLKTYKDYTYSYISDRSEIAGIREYAGVKPNISLKSYYNYHIKNYFVGIIVGAHDLSDRGNSIFGIQFGVNINKTK